MNKEMSPKEILTLRLLILMIQIINNDWKFKSDKKFETAIDEIKNSLKTVI